MCVCVCVYICMINTGYTGRNDGLTTIFFCSECSYFLKSPSTVHASKLSVPDKLISSLNFSFHTCKQLEDRRRITFFLFLHAFLQNLLSLQQYVPYDPPHPSLPGWRRSELLTPIQAIHFPVNKNSISSL